ncbi:4651_t:CDS:1, partial [Dentiscutata heterogama]
YQLTQSFSIPEMRNNPSLSSKEQYTHYLFKALVTIRIIRKKILTIW